MSKGVFTVTNIPKKSVTIQNSKRNIQDAPLVPVENLDAHFWGGMAQRKPLYGSDISASLMRCSSWNLADLRTDLSYLTDVTGTIEGVHTPFVYVGAWGTMFAWHVEDGLLGAINYLHRGQPKVWYVVSPSHKAAMDALLTRFSANDPCPGHQNHKSLVISPVILEENNIPYARVSALIKPMILNRVNSSKK